MKPSAQDDWKTPRKMYASLNTEFNFDFDPCPPNPTFDGLKCEWGTSNFLNPPYSDIKTWLKKAIAEQENGNTTVALLPARTGTDWFHECVLNHTAEIRFIRGRLQFNDCGVNAPFDSIVVIFYK